MSFDVFVQTLKDFFGFSKPQNMKQTGEFIRCTINTDITKNILS